MAAATAGSAGVGNSTAGTGGSTSIAGTSSGGSGGSVPIGSACANPIAISSTKPDIANFDGWDGATSLATWNFKLGGDSASGVLAGTFGYGDRSDGKPETFELSAGNDGSMYAMRIADTDPARTPGTSGLYGGGMGLWISSCLNAAAFTGISFWVRGSSPSPTATFTLGMGDTLSTTPTTAGGPFGTCPGDSVTCVSPTFAFPVTDTWTQIKAPWSGFKAGDAAGTPVTPDGKNITQVQWGVGLVFEPPPGDGGGTYVAVPAAYELAVDDVAFY